MATRTRLIQSTDRRRGTGDPSASFKRSPPFRPRLRTQHNNRIDGGKLVPGHIQLEQAPFPIQLQRRRRAKEKRGPQDALIKRNRFTYLRFEEMEINPLLAAGALRCRNAPRLCLDGPFPRAIDRFTVGLQPCSHLDQALAHVMVDRSIAARTDVQEQIRPSSGRGHQRVDDFLFTLKLGVSRIVAPRSVDGLAAFQRQGGSGPCAL